MAYLDTMIALNARLMAKFGAEAVLQRVTKVYDPATDEAVTTTVSVPILAALETVEVDGNGGVKSRETKLKSNSALAIADRVAFGGKTYMVESVQETAPTGVPIFWIATVSAS